MNLFKINGRANGKKKQQLFEADIIRRVVAGETELFEILVRRNNQKLYRVIRSYIREQAEVEDLMQNTYLKAYEKLHQFKSDAQFSTWLIKIGVNEALSRLKAKNRIRNFLDQSNDIASATVLEVPDPEQLNPERKMIRQEARSILEKAIDRLSYKYKTIYMLREIENMSMAEIADCLDLTVPNVKVRLHRARTMIKQDLYELSHDSEVFEFGSKHCDRLVENVMAAIQKREG